MSDELFTPRYVLALSNGESITLSPSNVITTKDPPQTVQWMDLPGLFSNPQKYIDLVLDIPDVPGMQTPSATMRIFSNQIVTYLSIIPLLPEDARIEA